MAGYLFNPVQVASPTSIANGGTNANTPAGARTNLGVAVSGVNGDITSLTGLTTPIASATQAVSAATTLTSASLPKTVLCTGGGYALTLAPASACSGQTQRVVMDAGLTGLVTLTGGGSDLIDGQATRIQWAGESASLYSDGTTWRKVGGKTIPMSASSKRTSLVVGNIASSTVVAVPLNVSISDPTGQMVDTTNGYLVARRPGQYLITAGMSLAGTDGMGTMAGALNTQLRLHKNGTGGTVLRLGFAAYPNPFYPVLSTAKRATLASGDNVTMCAYQTSGSACNVYVGGGSAGEDNSMELTEVPTW